MKASQHARHGRSFPRTVEPSQPRTSPAERSRHSRRPAVLGFPGLHGARRGFTLTELLIVVAIIAVLASLATVAAINAMRNGRRARILMEMQQLAAAFQNLKNDVGAYPPNVFPIGDPPPGLDVGKADPRNVADLKTFLSKAADRATELQTGGSPTSGNSNVAILSGYGISPAEAVVFWLQGFSSDKQRPLTGSDLVMTDIEDDEGNLIEDVVTIDSYKPLYDFDRGRLRISRDKDGKPRILTLYRSGSGSEAQRQVRILLYEYLAAGSEKPYVYFDTSRYTPYQQIENFSLEFYMSDDTGKVLPLKQLKRNAPSATTDPRKLEYVEQRKFQIMHPGLDDAWGNFEPFQYNGGNLDGSTLLYPDGPFVGDVADTLTNFFDGPLSDAQED